MTKKINIVLFGIGNAGSAFINKISKERKALILDSKLDFRFPVITNSTVAFYEKEGGTFSWEANFIQFAVPFRIEDIYDYIYHNSLENLIAVDATASQELVREYANLVRNGFNIVSVNSTLQKLHPEFEAQLRLLSHRHGAEYRFPEPKEKGTTAVADGIYNAVLDIAGQKSAAA